MNDTVSVKEAAQILDCSATHVRNQAADGSLDAVKVRGTWRIQRAALEHHPRPHETPQHNSDTTPPQQRYHATTAAPLQHNPSATPTPQLDKWRDDLLSQVANLEADKAALRDDYEARVAEMRVEFAHRVEGAKARAIDLERQVTMRDSAILDLREQVAVLEAKVREVLEKGQDEALQLANRIADLVERQQEVEARIHELSPVAEQVPMLQAAVEEKEATLSQRERELSAMRQDIEAIASRPVTGPVFRLLTKGRLRR